MCIHFFDSHLTLTLTTNFHPYFTEFSYNPRFAGGSYNRQASKWSLGTALVCRAHSQRTYQARATSSSHIAIPEWTQKYPRRSTSPSHWGSTASMGVTSPRRLRQASSSVVSARVMATRRLGDEDCSRPTFRDFRLLIGEADFWKKNYLEKYH